MKYIKKVMNILLIFVLLVPMFVAPYVVDAADNRTLRQILADIETQKKALEENETAKELTEAEIKTLNSNIVLMDAQIKKGNEDIIDLNNQIAELQVEIEAKDAEMRKIVNFLQVSNGESEYLEYTFGAKSFTDFIYRMAITEQLTDYNDKLITQYNDMIETNKNKQVEIKKKTEEVAAKQIELQKSISSLRAQVTSLTEEQGDIASGLEASEKLIQTLQNWNCDIDETITVCSNRQNMLPPDTSFWRPLNNGYITSLFGYRTLNGVPGYHYGLDIGVPIGTPVYAVASGKVVLKYYWAGTGYTIYVWHTVNGVNYTSVYEHLSSYVANVGDVVTKDTIIAYSGNTGKSFGAHLHLSILKGWAGSDYEYWENPTYYNMNVDPKTVINFPAGYGSFSTRNKNCSLGAC